MTAKEKYLRAWQQVRKGFTSIRDEYGVCAYNSHTARLNAMIVKPLTESTAIGKRLPR